MSQETTSMDQEPTITEGITKSPFSRRRFLIGTGAVGAAVVVAACGGDDDGTDTNAGGGSTDTSSGSSGDASGDLAVAQFAAGLEALAVGTYKAALDAATAGKLGAVPPAGAEFVKTAMAQHQEHLDAWNDALKKGGQGEVTQPNAQLKPTVDAEFAKVKDFGGAAKLALMLEEIAAATYLNAIPSLKDKAVIKQAASIQAIDAKHVAILLFVLGQYPVPDVFAKTDKAAKPA